jgi:hypothetical protein
MAREKFVMDLISIEASIITVLKRRLARLVFLFPRTFSLQQPRPERRGIPPLRRLFSEKQFL